MLKNFQKLFKKHKTYKFDSQFDNSHIKFHPKSNKLYIEGLFYYPDFIKKYEEELILDLIDKNPWVRYINRRQQHYGITYYHTRHNIPELQPIEKFDSALRLETFDFLIEKFMKFGFFDDDKQPNQCLINEYVNNQYISSHFDDERAFGDTIVSISLVSPIYFTMKNPEMNDEIKIFLDKNSLLILKDASRFKWKHGITQMKQIHHPDTNELIIYRDEKYRRISMTFRKLLENRKKSPDGEKSKDAIW